MSCDFFLYFKILAGNAESKRMDTGPSLDTIDQNATNDQSGLESNDHVIMKQDHLLKDIHTLVNVYYKL